MSIEGYVDYQRREYCKAVQCPVQAMLEKQPAGSKDYDQVRDLCIRHCIHTTYEFHHWLMENGFEVVKKEGSRL